MGEAAVEAEECTIIGYPLAYSILMAAPLALELHSMKAPLVTSTENDGPMTGLSLHKPLSGLQDSVREFRYPDPRRWDFERFAKNGATEDRELAEQGLEKWEDVLDTENQR